MHYLSKCEDATCGATYPGDLHECPKCGADSAFSSAAPLDIRDWIFDIETYPNIFTALFIHAATGMELLFEVSDRKDEQIALIEFMHNLGKSQARGVGFNNLYFDYPVLHWIALNPGCSVQQIYDKAMSIINSDDRWGSVIWDSEHIFFQLDLFKICHFDNKARSTSLKALEIAMKSRNVVDLPFPVGTMLNDAEKDVLISYNRHDVKETIKFYVRCLDSINFREELTKRYDRNFMNHNDTKIGKDYFALELEKSGVQCYTRTPNGRQPCQTKREFIHLKDVIFPYIEFERPEFNEILQKFRSKTLKKAELEDSTGTLVTKGVFKDLHCEIDGFTFVFGVGGIHGSVESQIVETTDTHQLIDVDVSSMYPSIAIVNRIFPEHLGDKFCDINEYFFEERMIVGKKTTPGAVYKLAMNGVYGDSNNPYSPFYDPKYTMTVTVNGQMMLAMLCEGLMNIDDMRIVQANTDGVTVLCPRDKIEQMRNVCKQWESATRLELEEVTYSRMMIRDVNNYIGDYGSGKPPKRKGAYEYQYQWHQDPSAMIAPMAAEAALVHGKDIRTFITSHRDPFDFMCRAKVPRGSKLVMRWSEWGAEKETQHTTRYFVSRNGGSMVKISPPTGEPGTWKRKAKVADETYYAVMREIAGQSGDVDAAGTPWDARIHTGNRSKHDTRELSICAGNRVTECADAGDFDWSDLNYEWYIAEAEKLVLPLLTGTSK